MLPLSGKGKNTCCKMFITYAHCLTGVALRNNNVDDVWPFVCSMDRIREGMSEVLMMPGIVFLRKRNMT